MAGPRHGPGRPRRVFPRDRGNYRAGPAARLRGATGAGCPARSARSVGLAPVSLAFAGALVDVGAVTLMFVVAGGIVVAAAIAGIAWGVPSQVVWPTEETAG